MRKKVLLALVAVVTAAFVGFFVGTREKNVTLKVDAEIWEGEALRETYALGEFVDIPSFSVKVGDETVDATYSVIFPDKTATADKQVRLTQAGTYNVEYRAAYGGKHYSVTKKFNVSMSTYSVGSSSSETNYGVYGDYGCTKEGVITYLTMKDTLTFTKLIDVEDLTMGSPFFEAYIVPETRGTADFNKLIVTLTDALNPDVYLRFEVNRYLRNTSASLGMAWVTAGGNGQDQVGFEKNGSQLHVNDGCGTPVDNVSFIAQRNVDGWGGAAVDLTPDASVLKLIYDAKSNSAYAGPNIIADMDDPAYYNTLWNGFSSGKVRLTVTADQYSNTYARFVVTNALGIDLTDGEDGNAKPFVDSDAPELTIDMDEMPLGQVNKHYKIPAASALDWYSGVCSVKTSVYFDYATENKILISIDNGEFIPPYVGDYVIEYIAKDYSGNEAKAIRSVKVKDKLSDITIELPESRILEGEIGDYVTIEKPYSYGGSGMHSVKIYAKRGDESFEITDKFLPEKLGEWTIEYVVTDYVGNEKTASYTFTCKPSDTPKIQSLPVLPRILLDDCATTLPVAYANDYSSGVRAEKLLKYEVTDAEGKHAYDAGASFVPHVQNNGDAITIRYYYGEKTLGEVSVPVVKVKDGSSLLLPNYFYGNAYVNSVVGRVNSAEGEALKAELGDSLDVYDGNYFLVNGLLVRADASGDAGWTFANQLAADGFEAAFGVVPSMSDYNALVVTLADALGGDSVTAYLTKQGSLTSVRCGNTVAQASVSLDTRGTFTISYSNKTLIVGTTKIAIDTADSGEKFNGFASGKIYATVTMQGASAGSGYIVNRICGTTPSYRNNDNSRPTIVRNGSLGGLKKLNDKMVIPAAAASDVYAPSVSMTLTVTAPDGMVISDVNGKALYSVPADVEYTVVLSQFGDYTLTYTMTKDKFVSSTKYTQKYTVSVADNTAPVITVSGEAPKEVKSGSTILLPKITVKDDLTAESDIKVMRYVITSAGKLVAVGDEYDAYIPVKTGKYQILFVAMDEAGNMTSVRYEVNVTA